MSLNELVYRVLIYAYPAAFRRRYRDDLIAFFRAHRDDPSYANRRTGWARFWTNTLWDLSKAALHERMVTLGRLVGLGSEQDRLYQRPTRQHRELPAMETIVQDLRYAIRTFARNPGFTLTAVTTLALGIGTNAAMFSIVNGVLLESLPYADADRVVVVWGTDTDGRFGVSDNERLRYREQTDIFQSFGTYFFYSANLTGPDGAERVLAGSVDDNVFNALGLMPFMGRTFRSEETEPGGDRVVVLSYGLWQQRFLGEASALGQTLAIGGRDFTIVGVVPRDFRLPSDFIGQPIQLYTPQIIRDPDPQNLHYLRAVARLRDDVTLMQTRGHMTTVGERLKEELGTLPPTFVPATVPVREVVLGEIQPILLILLGSVGLVLLIACVNVANLFLARSDGRTTETALRLALGAARSRLVQQVLTESVVLAILGGGLGLLIALVATDMVVTLNPPNVPRIDQIGINLSVIAFTTGLSFATALLFGLGPALITSKRDLQSSLHDGGKSSTSGAGRNRFRRTLVVTEVALAVMLAVGAGLLIRSFTALQAVEPGLNPNRVLTTRLTLPSSRYSDAASARAFYRNVLERVRALPGVVGAGATTLVPLASNPGDWGIRIEGREEERLASGRRPWADRIVITDGYFEALDIPVVEGRSLSVTDDVDGEQIVFVNETAARRYWPNESAVGKRFKLSANIDTIYRTVAGVTADVRHGGLAAEPRPQMYLPHAQHSATQNFPIGSMNLMIRTANDPLALAGTVRRTVAALDPGVPLSSVRTMDDVVAASTSTERLNVTLFGVFGLLGLLLVSVGVYGVMSYFISQRARELGIRIALGAAPRSVLRLVVNHGLRLALVGAAVGVVGALSLGRFLSNLLYGVTWHDPITLVTVPALVTGVAVLACVIPARRAVRVDPINVLRSE